MKIGIYGAGGNGKTIVDLIKNINKESIRYDEIIFIDDVTEDKMFYNTPVFSFEETKERYSPDELEIVISLGEPKSRELLYKRVKNSGYKLPILIDKHANISDTTKIGEGTSIANAFVGPDCRIGVNCIVSQNAIIGHDVEIGNHCDISAGTFIGGYCKLKDKIFMGPKSSMRDRLNIGDSAIIGLGAAVYKDVPDEHTALGNPAKIVKHNNGEGLFKIKA